MIDVKNLLKEKAGDFLQYDESKIIYSLKEMYKGKVELVPMNEAIKRPEVKKRIGTLLQSEEKFSKKVLKERTGGYFVKVLKNQHVDIPIQTCILMSKSGEQKPYNMIVLEEGASATVYTGCSAAAITGKSFHIGATEFFIGEGAHLNYVMLHVWPKDVEVRPRSAALVEKNGSLHVVYAVLRPGALIQSNPVIKLRENASAQVVSILRGTEHSKMDIGGELHFEGRNSSGLIKSRSVVNGNSHITARAKLVARAPSKGHVDCRAILMGDKSSVEAIPIIESSREDATMTHEASVGKIEDDQLFYLESRGFTEEDAREMIIKGFLSPDMPWLSERMNTEIDRIVALSARGS